MNNRFQYLWLWQPECNTLLTWERSPSYHGNVSSQNEKPKWSVKLSRWNIQDWCFSQITSHITSEKKTPTWLLTFGSAVRRHCTVVATNLSTSQVILPPVGNLEECHLNWVPCKTQLSSVDEWVGAKWELLRVVAHCRIKGHLTGIIIHAYYPLLKVYRNWIFAQPNQHTIEATSWAKECHNHGWQLFILWLSFYLLLMQRDAFFFSWCLESHTH